MLHCPHDDTAHPDEARYCMACGQLLPRPSDSDARADSLGAAAPAQAPPSRRRREWEYEDLHPPRTRSAATAGGAHAHFPDLTRAVMRRFGQDVMKTAL